MITYGATMGGIGAKRHGGRLRGANGGKRQGQPCFEHLFCNGGIFFLIVIASRVDNSFPSLADSELWLRFFFYFLFTQTGYHGVERVGRRTQDTRSQVERREGPELGASLFDWSLCLRESTRGGRATVCVVAFVDLP